MPIFSKPFTDRIVNYPVDEELFWKKEGPKTLTFSKKNQFKKKNRGSSRVEGSGLQIGTFPNFFLTTLGISFFVRYFKRMFVFGNCPLNRQWTLRKLKSAKKKLELRILQLQNTFFSYIVKPLFSKPFHTELLTISFNSEVYLFNFSSGGGVSLLYDHLIRFFFF